MSPALRVCALALFPLLVRLPARPQETEPQATELERHMHVIEDTVRAMRRGLREDPTGVSALPALARIESLTLACKELVPASAAALPEAERPAYVVAFRHTMLEFLSRQIALENALLDGEPEAIRAAFERFREMEDLGHERFAPDEEH